MTSLNFQDKQFNREILRLLISLTKKLGNLCSRIKCMIWRRPRNRLVVKRLGKLRSKLKFKGESHSSKSKTHLNGLLCGSTSRKPIRIATFNAALFAVAPVVPKLEMCSGSGHEEQDNRPDTVNNYPRSILKQSISHSTLDNPQQKFTKSKLRVSINLPENEISLARGRLLTSMGDEEEASSSGSHRSNAPVRSPLCFPLAAHNDDSLCGCKTTILEVLREVDADILALQDVKAEEAKGMRPLSDLAGALDMKYVFAESWAPEYGNAVLSKWPIRRWRVQKILNDEDIRNVLKATIDIPWMGEVNIYCTQLDYLDEDWRMEQMKEIIQSSEGPHILAGGLNSLDRSDYSSERWTGYSQVF
ncbi:hypothetical protein Nepgr_020640 [Nepenthes gracilis]|uniref:Endonuclease/exonuclease/phosphatase domain-containing protein n=1 Tax=Nepenthes gracilis TaxID=150966 RepID=A0AAD3SXZ8_NEPGR|nr:hypothetical protein Nepgr_020640 [Nepenthes gracilis]